MLKYCKTLVSDIGEETYRKTFEYMCSRRQNKVKAYKLELMQKQTLAGESLAKNLISEVWGLNSDKLCIVPDAKGKLYADGHPNIHLSISHSVNTIAVAVSDKPVGIDAEEIRPRSLKIASYFCLENELIYIFGHLPSQEELSSVGEGEILKRFLEVWTLKEAYFKCIGTGITDLKSINVLGEKIHKTDISDENAIINIVTL